MRIAIATDSRGTLGEISWVTLLQKKLPQHSYFISLINNTSFTSLLNHTPHLLAEENFDIIIIQLGYHEYVVPWQMSFWKQEMPDFDPQYAQHLTPFPEIYIGSNFQHKKLNYRNDRLIQNLFAQIKAKTNHLCFITMPYSWEEFKENTIMMNEVYSKCCDSSIILPMNSDFPLVNTYNTPVDRVHYLPNFAEQLTNMVVAELKL